jgi:hypothetical protein
MEVIYGTSLNCDKIETIMKKINNNNFINFCEYKDFAEEINNNIKKKLKKITLQIYPISEYEAEGSNELLTIGYKIQYLGYYSKLPIAKIDEKLKKKIENEYETFCKYYDIEKNELSYIIMYNAN